MVRTNWPLRRSVVGKRSYRRGYGRFYKNNSPTSKVLVHASSVLQKESITGAEIKPSDDVGRYKMKKVMLTCTVKMPPGELMNFLVVRSSSVLANWANLFSTPALLVKEPAQDMVTIIAKGKIESVGSGVSEVTKSFNRFIYLGSGVSQTQHVYVIMYSSASVKVVLEHRMYVEV
ncbi:capsid protein [Milk vetch chlorotic dwarf virus]|uniref:Capsid protein n=1 Tax=Milk vetch chlorotic dwarf virus TaxID=2683340 RepID=A0A650FYV8_9VIRU|nr:capsid protein [Milk vetch chlorotic dwarf virus]QGV56710.1 capsid protein [Milk vetch chlorotic dwarf virus]